MEKLFETIWGQRNAIGVLAHNLSKKRVASAYLFSGPQGTGKIKAALILAKSLLCKTPGNMECSCRSCRMFGGGAHPDFMGVVPTKEKDRSERYRELIRHPDQMGKAHRGRTIKIEQVRELISALSLKSYEGGRKVVVIEAAETMNRQTANAFLKTLEEPPSDTVLVLVTSSPSALLPTIVSRCRVVRFVPMKPEELAVLLERHNSLEADEALRVAELAEGRPGLALDEEISHVKEVDSEVAEILSRILEMEPEEVIGKAEGWKKRREDVPLLFQRIMEALRLAIRPTSTRLSGKMALVLKVLGELPPERLIDGYYAVLDTMPMLAFNPNVQLIVESTIFNLQSILLKGESLADRVA